MSSGISATRGFSKSACVKNEPNESFVIEKNFDSHVLNVETDEISETVRATMGTLLKSYGIKYVENLRNNLHLLHLTLTK